METGKKMSEEKIQEAAPEQNEAPKQKPSRRKKILKGIGYTLLGLLVLLIIVFIFRDPVIRIATCKVGSFLTGTKVELKHFSSSVTGTVHLQGFSVGNPEGYSPANAIEFKEIFVSIDIPSVLSDTIRINQIRVAGMNVNFETKFNETNLGKIQANLDRISNAGKEEAPSGSGDVADKKKKQQKVFIAKLDAEDNSVAITSTTLNQTFKLPLLPMHLTDIGGESIVDTLSELTTLIISSVGKAAGNVGGAIGDAFKSAGDQAGQLGKGIAEGGKKLFKPLTDKLK